MLNTYEATVNDDGKIELVEPITLPTGHRVLVTVLPKDESSLQTTLLSQNALAVDWNKPEEDEAWAHLQPPTSS